MKTREIKQQDLAAITESLANSKSAMIVSFTKLTVQKDQEFRNSLRDAGAQYQVVKNTLARIAVKGTQLEQATEAFKGVTAIAWTENDPVILSKAISKFMKDNAETYTFKTGVVEGKLVDLAQLTTIANLPSKEDLISKLLFVLNAQAQRIVTVINAVPRDLAVVIKQIGEQEGRAAGTPKVEAAAPAENEGADDAAAAEVAADVPSSEGVDDAAAAEVAAPEAAATEATAESAANAPDDAAQAEAENKPAEEPAAE
ncbi:MAG: 50S ribosomal protein L10 [Pyrinomonadaceae bacterium]